MACRLGNMWKQAFAMLVLAVTLGSHGARGEECQTILQVAEEANLNSLIAALNAAGLNVPIQDTDSSFTVMAPTDAAFDSLLEDLDMTFAELAANETLLSTVLGYHALPPNLPENLAGPVPTLTGQDLFVNFTGKVVGENVTIEAGPVPACLAQIYVIDAVLVPENFTCTPLADVALAENLTLFLEVVNQTDFSEVNVSPLRTVFAPTNEAIANFLSEYNVTLTGENEDLGFLAQVLAYHSVETFILPDGWGEFETINGQQLPVNFSDGTVGDNVNIISGQQIACLSQLFVIDGVLIPNDTACPSIYDFAKESGFDVLVELVDAAGLAPFLSNIVNRFSVFAPSDAAFADLLPYGITTEVLKQNTTLLSEILKYHIVPGYLPPGVLGEFETMFGEKLSLNLPGRKVEKDVNITLSANVCTSKVNAIDAVLTPSGLTCPSVAQLAETLGLEDLVQALNATDLIAPLSAPNIISTVFAPTNEAFNTTLTELGLTFDDLLANTTRLTEILSYHVIGRILPPTADDKFETLDGIELAVDLPEKKVGDNVNITTEEPVQACLSQVYVIDAVLIPPQETCDTVIQVAETAGFTSLVTAVDTAGLRPSLSDPTAELTVFAPTNEAFNTTLTELGLTFDDLLANTTRLTEILSYHVIGRILPPTADDKFETLDGIELAVDLPEKKVGDNVNITAEEPVQACLSQVYVIDAVLIPRGQQDSGNSKLLFSLKGLVISSWVQIGLLIFGLRI